MSDSDPPNRRPHLKPLAGWTMISSQGEVISGDEEADNSDSSIEIVSTDGNGALYEDGSLCLKDAVVPDPLSTPEHQVDEKERDICNVDSQTSSITQPLITQQQSLELKGPLKENICSYQTQHNSYCSNSKDKDNSFDYQNKDQHFLNSQVQDCEISGTTNETAQHESSSLVTFDDLTQHQSTDGGADAHLGACCADMLTMKDSSENIIIEDESIRLEDGVIPELQKVNDLEKEEYMQGLLDAYTEHKNDEGESSSDSDFVCLDQESPEGIDHILFAGVQDPLVEERVREGVLLPLRLSCSGSSIGPDFNFMRDLTKRECYSDNGEGNSDEDTESCTEDSVADHIESEQSEVSSGHYGDDVGDLSSFDIGEIPLEAGDVARNYRHQPNSNLDSILNTMLVLSAILTMGISLGIMMATDLEIEEWQNAYEKEAEKVKVLEEQTKTLENLWKYYKKESFEMEQMVLTHEEKNAFFKTLKQKAFEEDKDFYGILIKLQEAQEAWMNYSQKGHEPWSDNMCGKANAEYDQRHHTTYDNIVFKIDILKQTAANYSSPIEELQYVDDELSPSEENKYLDLGLSIDNPYSLKENLERSGERNTKNGNNLNHLEGGEEDSLIDSFTEQHKPHASQTVDKLYREDPISVLVPLDTRQLQQSLTREQERALHWQQLYLAERRQREKDRESEEWEDERDREKALDQEEADRIECLQKLMATNLTTLTQHVLKWNVSVFDDFANLSMLMSTVAELQQSVINSVHKVWEEAEEVVSHVGGGDGKGGVWDDLPNKETFINYFNTVVKDVKEEMENTFKDAGETATEEQLHKGENSWERNKDSQNEDEGSTRRFGRFTSLIKRTRKSVKKIGKKISGFLIKVQDTLGNGGQWFSKVGSYFKDKLHKDAKKDKFKEHCFKSLNKWFKVNNGLFQVNVQSECVGWIREGWQDKLTQSPCRLFSCEPSQPDDERMRLKEQANKMSERYTENLNYLLSGTERVNTELYTDGDFASVMVNRFVRYLAKWDNSPFRLGIDSKWAECHLRWWNNDAIKMGGTSMVQENQCNWIVFESSQIHRNKLSLENVVSLVKSFKYNTQKWKYVKADQIDGKKHDNFDQNQRHGVDEHGFESNDTSSIPDEKAKKETNSYTNQNTTKQEKNQNSFRQAFEYLQRKSPSKNGNVDVNPRGSSEYTSGEWLFKIANERDLHRREDHRSDWMFERAEGRRSISEEDQNEDSNYAQSEYVSHDKRHEHDWYMKHGNERERMRKQDHQSNWVFERAEDREAYRKHYGQSTQFGRSDNDDDDTIKYATGKKQPYRHHKWKRSPKWEKKQKKNHWKGLRKERSTKDKLLHRRHVNACDGWA